MQRKATSEEKAFVRKWAGKQPLGDIAAALGITTGEVRAIMRKMGIPHQLFGQHLYWCNSCSRWRTWLDRKDKCRPCILKGHLEAAQERFSKAFARAPQAVKETYNREESRRGTKVFDPLPKRMGIDKPNSARAIIEELRFAAAMEQWECRKIQRVINKEKKRVERIRRHLGENPRG